MIISEKTKCREDEVKLLKCQLSSKYKISCKFDGK